MKEAVARTKGNHLKRLNMIADLCKAKKVCEGGDEIDDLVEPPPEDQQDVEVKKGEAFLWWCHDDHNFYDFHGTFHDDFMSGNT